MHWSYCSLALGHRNSFNWYLLTLISILICLHILHSVCNIMLFIRISPMSFSPICCVCINTLDGCDHRWVLTKLMGCDMNCRSGRWRIMHELPRITIFGSWVRKFANNFHWQIASQVTQKSLFTVTNVLFYFLLAILCIEHTIPLITVIDRWFHRCRYGQYFLTQHCDVTTVDLGCHANMGYWHCDVTFIDCSCTRKLVPKAIFTSEKQPWISISQHPVFMA